MTVRQAFSLGAGVCVVAFLAGCGSSGGTGGPTSSGASCNGSAAVSSLGTPTETIDATDTLVFDPASTTAKVGDVVEFKNSGSVEHTVTFQGSNDSCLSDATLDPGATWEVKFTTAGTYNYLCTIHAPNMKGEITVTS